MEAAALLVIDMQQGLLDKKTMYRRKELIDNVNRLIEFFHREKASVFLIRHENATFLKRDTQGWQLSMDMVRSDTDILMDKTHGSVFREQHFERALQSTGLKAVVVTGLVSNGCVRAACLDAKAKGYNVVLISDAHSTFAKDAKKTVEAVNAQLSGECIRLCTTDEYTGIV